MVSITCWTCETSRDLGPVEPIQPFCSEECLAEFDDVVACLAVGGSFDEAGVEPGSLLARRAVEVVITKRRSERIEAREWREWEYERNRPREASPAVSLLRM